MKKCIHSYNKSAGYNLLMVSIALIVVGIIAAGSVQIYALYKETKDINTTQSRVSTIIKTIQDYKNNSGRFPCPSSINEPRGNLAYGTENCALTTAAGNCAGGLCVINGRATLADRAVVIGAVPFRLLQLDEKEIYDAYGSRLLYAVTRSQTVVATFNEVNGAIDIVDENGGTLVNPQGSASFVVLSQGKNKYGAFSIDGTQTFACTAGVREAANCLNFTTPPAAPYTMVSSLTYLAGGNTQFDDVIEYFSSTEPTRWRRTDANQDDIQTITNSNVGISGVSTPTQTLDINQGSAVAAAPGIRAKWDGALRVTDKIDVGTTGKICDMNGTNCFKPSDFINGTQINCNSATTNKYMIGIKGNGTNALAECGYVKSSCPTGQVFRGVNTSGQPICSTVGSGCNALNVQVCDAGHTVASPHATTLRSSNEIITHPSSTTCGSSAPPCTGTGTGAHGSTLTVYDPDSFSLNRARATFTCNNGVWVKPDSGWGFCGCTTPSLPAGCGGLSESSPSCTYTTTTCNGYASGTNSVTTSLTADCTLSTVTNSSTCACPYANYADAVAAGKTNSTGGCSSGYTATYGWNNSASVCNYTKTCSCTVPAVKTQTLPTPVSCSTAGLVGYTGSAYVTQTFDSGSCSWVNSGYDTSGCTCGETGTTTLATTCNASCQDTNTSPTEYWHYEGVGGTCTKIVDSTTTGTCSNKTFHWQITSYTSSSSSSGAAPNCGSSCHTGCPAPNAMSGQCDTPASGGGFNVYSATCQ